MIAIEKEAHLVRVPLQGVLRHAHVRGRSHVVAGGSAVEGRRRQAVAGGAANDGAVRLGEGLDHGDFPGRRPRPVALGTDGQQTDGRKHVGCRRQPRLDLHAPMAKGELAARMHRAGERRAAQPALRLHKQRAIAHHDVGCRVARRLGRGCAERRAAGASSDRPLAAVNGRALEIILEDQPVFDRLGPRRRVAALAADERKSQDRRREAGVSHGATVGVRGVELKARHPSRPQRMG